MMKRSNKGQIRQIPLKGHEMANNIDGALPGLRIAHLGINAKDADESAELAQRFCMLLGLEFVETPLSHFAAPLVEVMDGTGRGARGHIGLHVDDIPLAEKYFIAHGLAIDESSRRLNPDGSTFLVYFVEEIAGFAIHLTRG
jgi:catechol 2,3-dioxygenase-like lactoylglutathione lyase family enzyme